MRELSVLFISIALTLSPLVVVARPKKGEELYYNLDVPDGIETHLTEEDFARGKYVYSSRFKRSESQSKEATQTRPPMENKNYFEGDIRRIGGTLVHPHDKIEKIELDKNGTVKESIFRNAIKEGVGSDYYKWPVPFIPYTISARYSSYSRSRIAAALDEYGKSTCIQFVKKTCEPDYVSIAPIDGCFSDVGKAGGKQELSLESGCFDKGTILHELTHTVGFFHEQSRTDRDQYIDILWKNIEDGYEDQFQKYNALESDNQGINYDYYSLMHYSSTAFSKTNKSSGVELITIRPKQPGFLDKIGQRNDFSSVDLQEIKKLYNCANAGLNTGSYTPSCTQQTGNCTDVRNDCAFLSKYHWPPGSTQRYCDSQRNFMQKNCAKSCGLCSTAGPVVKNCTDSFAACPGWGQLFCSHPSFSVFMRNNCKKTCNTC